jgi:mediator of RNA polymerase II transcription subunit 13
MSTAAVETPFVHFDLTLSSPMSVDLDSDDENELEESGFGALNFGRDRGALDQKYSNGKYSLPSPPPDDRSRSANYTRGQQTGEEKSKKGNGGRSEPWKSTTARDGHLRARYMEATHPSRAMLFQLAGSKRDWGSFSMSQAGASTEPVTDPTATPAKKRRLTWSMSGETWRNPTPPMDDSEDEGDDAESSIAGEDEWSGDFDLGVLGIDTEAHNGQQKQDGLLPPEDPTRLLQAHFDYDWILKNEVALPSDLSLPNETTPHTVSSRRSSVPPAPVSVPTPVSPEAISGHSNDTPAKLLPSVAQQIAKQVECNPLWNSVTTAIRVAYSSHQFNHDDVWQGEVDALSKSLHKLRWTDWDVTIADSVESEDCKLNIRRFS